MASAAAAVPGRTWWTSKQASTAKGQNGEKISVFMCPAFFLLLLLFCFVFYSLHDECDMITSFKAQGVHGNSRVKVPKLPFSASYSNKRAEIMRVSAQMKRSAAQSTTVLLRSNKIRET